MSATRREAEHLADLVVKIAMADPRRGVTADALIAARLHRRELLLVELIEVLAHRAAGHPVDEDVATLEERAQLTDALTRRLAGRLDPIDTHPGRAR